MFQIDRFGRQPIYEQIIEQVEQFVASGALRPDDQLPSVRTLSQTLSANPNTLQKAYAELERRGVTVSVPGSGRYVSKDAPKLVAKSMEALLGDVATLCTKLRAAGISKEKVLDAVTDAYAAADSPAPVATASAARPEAKSSQINDAPASASGKDKKQ